MTTRTTSPTLSELLAENEQLRADNTCAGGCGGLKGAAVLVYGEGYACSCRRLHGPLFGVSS